MEGRVGDRWAERGEKGMWVRVHKTPRASLFSPKSIPNGPGEKKRLAATRETIGINELGERFTVSDDWTQAAPRSSLSRMWTVVTLFKTMPVGDLKFGGDQRRQRDRLGLPQCSPVKARVSWADLGDSS